MPASCKVSIAKKNKKRKSIGCGFHNPIGAFRRKADYKHDKTLQDVMSGKKDGNIKFSDLCNLLEYLGINLQRIAGSHHVFAFPGVVELIDLQPDKKDHSKAKSYQVRQVRKFIEKYLEV